jgi:N-acyl-D-amino-acid deacylase
MFDVILRGGRIVDGSGLPWFAGDIAIEQGRIAAIGPLDGVPAMTEIDVRGRVVSPGFVDAHVHGDLPMLIDPAMDACVRQGVTTLILGQDGVAFSTGPRHVLEFMHDTTAGFNGRVPLEEFTWDNVAGYLERLHRRTAINAATLIPNGNIRMAVMGLEERPPTASELLAMKRLVREGMEQGAVGLSSGLDYIPSLYADEHELAELCKEITSFGGVYVTHMRGYHPGRFLPAMTEVKNIGRRAGCGVHVSHFNVLARDLDTVDMIRADGVDLTYDLYPYLHGSTILAMLALPPGLSGGGVDAITGRLHDPVIRRKLDATFAEPRFPLETIRLANLPHPVWQAFEGRLLVDVAAEVGMSLVDLICELLIATRLQAGCVIRHFAEREEADIHSLTQHPAMMAGSDGIYCGGFPHPRGAGCFAKYLGDFVRRGVWTLGTVVRHLAYHPARRHGLVDRGLLVPGFAADIVVFDAEKIQDRSTFLDGRRLAVGVEQVLVNGEFVLRDGERTTARPGQGLRRGRSSTF